jgi:hypothetical protein
MKLKYKILWIEDELGSIERPKNQIQKYLEDDYGFECKEEDIVIKDYDDFEEEYIYEENNQKMVKDSIKEFDLLLVDFNLGEEEQTGDKLIEIIRKGIYSEILFYSSDLPSITKKLNNHFIDGVFTSDREHLEDKIKKLIKVTIKKVQDVNNLRGLILAEVAELDRIKNRIVKIYCEITENKDNVLKKYVKTDVFSDFKTNLDKYHFLTSEDEKSYEQMELHKFIDDLMYMSNKKSLTVYKIKRLYEPVKSVDFTHQNYFNDVIKKRNVFAHETEKEDKRGKYLNYPDGNRLDFTEEECIRIRKDIKKHKKLLDEIEKKLIDEIKKKNQ